MWKCLKPLSFVSCAISRGEGKMADKKSFVVAESIETKILATRGQKVMLDVDLA